MERILLMVIRNILLVPVMAVRLLYHAARSEKYTEKEHYQMLKYIVRRANLGGNVTIKSYGVDHIPQNEGVLFTPNHQGMYDVLAMIDTCEKPFSFVLKKEVKDIPFLKQLFKCVKAFAMDREDVRQSLTVIKNVAQEIKKGRSYVIFPEGTRSKHGNNLGEFKPGSFKAAIMAKCPIVPVALIDAFKPFDSHSITQTEVQIHYLEPISYNEYKEMKTAEIAAEVKARIENKISEYIKK